MPVKPTKLDLAAIKRAATEPLTPEQVTKLPVGIDFMPRDNAMSKMYEKQKVVNGVKFNSKLPIDEAMSHLYEDQKNTDAKYLYTPLGARLATDFVAGVGKGILDGSGVGMITEGIYDFIKNEQKTNPYGKNYATTKSNLNNWYTSLENPNKIKGVYDNAVKYGNFASQLSTSFGFVAGTGLDMLAFKGVGTAIKGAGTMIGMSSAAKNANLGFKIGMGTYKAGSFVGKAAANPLAVGMFSGVMEARSNAHEAKEKAKQAYISHGVSEEVAEAKGEEVFWANLWREVIPVTALNGVQAAILFKGAKSLKGFDSGISGNLGKVFSVAGKNKYYKGLGNRAKRFVDGVAVAALEAPEEAFQTALNSYVVSESLKEAGIYDKDYNSLSKAIYNEETGTAAILGAVGGVVLPATMSRLNKIGQMFDSPETKEDRKKYNLMTKQLIEGYKNITDKYTGELKAAEEKGDQKEIAKIKKQMMSDISLVAIRNDYQNGNDIQFDNLIQNTNSLIESLDDPNKIKTLGYTPEEAENTKNNLKTFVDNTIEFRQGFMDGLKKTKNENLALNYANTKVSIKNANSKIKENEGKVQQIFDDLETKYAGLNNSMIDSHIETMEMIAEIKALDEIIKRTKPGNKHGLLTKKSIALQEQLKELIKTSKENQTIEDFKDYQQYIKDNEGLAQSFFDVKMDSKFLDNVIDQHNAYLDKMSEKDYQYKLEMDNIRDKKLKKQKEKALKIKNKNKIANEAENSSEESVEEQILPELTPEQIEHVANKKEQIEKQNELDELEKSRLQIEETAQILPEISSSSVSETETAIPLDTNENSAELPDIFAENTPQPENQLEEGIVTELEEPYQLSLSLEVENTLSPAAKAVKNVIDDFTARNKPTTFEYYVNALEDATSASFVLDRFNNLVAAWKENGYPETNFNKVRENLQGAKNTILNNLPQANQEVITPMDVISEVTTSEKEDSKEETAEDVVTARKINTPSLKIAYNVMKKSYIVTTNNSGNTVNVPVYEGELNPDVDHSLINQEVQPGDEIQIKLSDELFTIDIPFTEKTEDGEVVYKNFETFMKDKGIKKGTDMYYKYVPIMIYHKSSGNIIGYIHDEDFYLNRDTVADTTDKQKIVNEAVENIRNIRNAVKNLEPNEILEGAIDTFTRGAIEKVANEPINKMRPVGVRLATLDNKMQIKAEDGEIISHKDIINYDDISDHEKYYRSLIEIHETPIKGKYFISYAFNPDISNEDATTFSKLLSMRKFLMDSKVSEDEKSENRTLAKEIEKKYGINILIAKEFEELIKNYVVLQSGSFLNPTLSIPEILAATDAYFSLNANNTNKGVPYAFMHSGSFYFGKIGMKLADGKQTQMYKNDEKGINSLDLFLSNVGRPVYLSYNNKNLNGEMPVINAKNELSHKSVKENLISQYTTNIKAFETKRNNGERFQAVFVNPTVTLQIGATPEIKIETSKMNEVKEKVKEKIEKNKALKTAYYNAKMDLHDEITNIKFIDTIRKFKSTSFNETFDSLEEAVLFLKSNMDFSTMEEFASVTPIEEYDIQDAVNFIFDKYSDKSSLYKKEETASTTATNQSEIEAKKAEIEKRKQEANQSVSTTNDNEIDDELKLNIANTQEDVNCNGNTK